MTQTSYNDMRDFIARVDEAGDLRRLSGAQTQFEIGAITEVAAGRPNGPALLFDDIPGYAKGFRVFSNAATTPGRAAIALGLDPKAAPLDILKGWMARRRALTPIKPVTVQTGPVLENSVSGDGVNVELFPAPVWHRKDGGPYIGSGALVIMRDPDTGWINASIYRVQVHGKTRVTVQFDHNGRHGAVIAKKYWDQGRSCPVAVVVGQDPALFIAGFEYLPAGASEYDFAGAIKGRPIELIDGPKTGLPVPAQAEIVLEGELLPIGDVSLPEGPFGEFTGYYAADKRPGPVMEVQAIHYRNDPILFGSPPMKPPRFHFGLPFRAAGIWDNLETVGVTDVVGVWQHVSQLMTVVAIKQRYAGHAKRAGLIAAAQSYMGRMVVVVDDDIDPSNLADVMWAVTTRCEPSESVDIVREAWSSSLDPRIPLAARTAGATSNSKMIIDACRPLSWQNEFPIASALSLDEVTEVERRWGRALERP
jgi:UbiD family decarboxylase